MANSVAATIAVVGTLLGSTVTYLFQRRSTERMQTQAFKQQLRTERLTAYSGFVTAVTLFRRAQLEWVNRRLEDPASDAVIAARGDAFRRRGEAQAALSQVRLVAVDHGLVAAARKAMKVTEPMYGAANKAEMDARNEDAKKSLQGFIDLAAAEIQMPLRADGVSGSYAV